MHIVFAHPEPIDARKARWVAIARTVAAVAKRESVTWLTPDSPQRVQQYAREHLAMELPPSVTIRSLPSLHGKMGLTVNRVFFRACRAALAEVHGDVLWVRSDKLAAGMVANQPVPLVYEAHLIGPLWARDRGDNERRAAKLQEMEVGIYKGAAAVAAISQGLLDEIKSLYGFAGPTEVVPSAVDTRLFKPTWNGGDHVTVVYAGSLQFWKGLDTLLHAIAKTRMNLLVIGTGSKSEIRGLRHKAEELGLGERVQLLGHKAQSELPELVGRCACAVHPSPGEHSISSRYTSPLKLFEYMALGMPIVAADVASVREVLTDGVNARLYKAGNVAFLAAGMEQLATTPRLAVDLSKAAIRTAAAYTYDARAEKLISLFRRV